MGVVIRPEPFAGALARRLVEALDADLDERYADDVDIEGEPDREMLDVLHDDVTPPRGIFVVAELEGEIVGCGALRPHGEGTAEIKRMYVAPSARRRGVARAVLRALEAHAAGFGYRRAILETGTRQQEAMALYESEGWTPIASFGAYRGSPLSRCYEKPLSPRSDSC
jgi:GNAT superfamily N-acetyltransferase